MARSGGSGANPMWKQQEDAVLTQANPTSGTKNVVLATTTRVRIKSIYVTVTWTVQPTPLEVHVTIDGVVWVFNVANPVSTTGYYATLAAWGAKASQALDTTNYSVYAPFLLEGKSVKVEVETTGGTVSEVHCRVKYARRV